MNYSESLEWLNSFANLEKIVLEKDNRFLNLKRMEVLLDWFGQPHKSFLPVIIAGTKGKGSTGFFLEQILLNASIPVGFYTSPHLVSPRERIRINGGWISEVLWARGLTEIKMKFSSKKWPAPLGAITYFEIMTLLSLWAFRRSKIKVGILEVGIGGRLDATNSVKAPIAIITPIHKDHEAFLGNTIAEIAGEKAGVIHEGAQVILSPQVLEAQKVIVKQARLKKAELLKVSKDNIPNQVGLVGEHQKVNAASAILATRLLQQKYGFAIKEASIQQGIRKKEWPGRWEWIPGKPSLLLDGAHNPISIEAIVRELNKKKRIKSKNAVLIFGVARDKNSKAMLKSLASYFENVILTSAQGERAKEVSVLMAEADPFKNKWITTSVIEALNIAKKIMPKGTVVATGSFYLIGEIKKNYE